MGNIIQILKKLVLPAVIVSTFFSCIDRQVENLESDAQAKLDAYLQENNYTADEHKGFGIYVRIIDNSADTGQMPVIGNTVLVEYDGKYTDGEVFETTNKDNATGIPYSERYIYGSKRLLIGYLMYGLDTALRTMKAGQRAEIVIPHTYAFGNYKPVVYDITLKQVIEDEVKYEEEEFLTFLSKNGFNQSDQLGDTTYIYYKLNEGEELLIDTQLVNVNDTVVISITKATYALFNNGGEAQIFYPRPDVDSTTMSYIWGVTTGYPINSAIDSAVKYIDTTQTIQIAVTSGADPTYGTWGYGTSGISDAYTYTYIIPPVTPLFYNITLHAINPEDED